MIAPRAHCSKPGKRARKYTARVEQSRVSDNSNAQTRTQREERAPEDACRRKRRGGREHSPLAIDHKQSTRAAAHLDRFALRVLRIVVDARYGRYLRAPEYATACSSPNMVGGFGSRRPTPPAALVAPPREKLRGQLALEHAPVVLRSWRPVTWFCWWVLFSGSSLCARAPGAATSGPGPVVSAATGFDGQNYVHRGR